MEDTTQEMALHQTVSTHQQRELHTPSHMRRLSSGVLIRNLYIYTFQWTAPFGSIFKCLFDTSQRWDLLLSRLTGAGAVLVGRIAWVGCIGPALGALLALGTGAGCALAGCWT